MVNICIDKNCEHTGVGEFCSSCGKGTIPYFLKCPHCGKEISIRNKFCEKCGKPVQEEVKAFIEKERKEVELHKTEVK